MSQRVKYPLTPEAKEAARQLVKAWDTGKLPQLIPLYEIRNDGGSWHTGFKRQIEVDFEPPHLCIWLELAEFKLIRYIPATPIRPNDEPKFQVLLLQELRNAVESDFDVSDYFLTTSAVGTIIYGDLTLDKNALFQSAAAGIGDVTLTAETLPDELEKLLGAKFLEEQAAVNSAIQELRTADQPSRAQKAGKVIEELGRYMGHVGSAGSAITAIAFIAKVFGVIP